MISFRAFFFLHNLALDYDIHIEHIAIEFCF